MDDSVPMKVFEALARLTAHRGDLAFSHQIRSDDVRERAALHVLHHDPQLVLVKERVDVVDNIRVPRRAHNEDLVDDKILLGLLVEVHLLNCHRKVRADLVCGVDAAACAGMQCRLTLVSVVI